MTAKIYYLSPTGEKINFTEFLRQEKEQRGLTWPALSALCEVKRISAYATRNSGGKPNYPALEEFSQIVTRLGYSLEDFEHNQLIRREDQLFDTPEAEAALRKIGDFILEQNRDARLQRNNRKWRFSSYVIRNVGGEEFYSHYGQNQERREELYAQLVSLDTKYSQIKLQQWEHAKGKNRRLIKTGEFSERKIIEEAICAYLEQDAVDRAVSKRKKELSGGELPRGTSRYVCEYLNEQLRQQHLPERTLVSVRYLIDKLWFGRTKQASLSRGSPAPALMLTDTEAASLSETVEAQSKVEPKTQSEAQSLTERLLPERLETEVKAGYSLKEAARVLGSDLMEVVERVFQEELDYVPETRTVRKKQKRGSE